MPDIVIVIQRKLDDLSLPREEHDLLACAAREIERLRGVVDEQIERDLRIERFHEESG